MKKVKALVVIALIFSVQTVFGQEEAKELFKTEFSELANTNLQSNEEIGDEQVAKFRFLYDKLKTTDKEIETYKYGGATDENMTVFRYKDLRSLERSEEVNDLDSIVNKKHMSLKNYLADKTKYGADSIECIEESSILKTLMDSEDYKNAYPVWKRLFTYYPISSKNIYIWGETLIEEKVQKAIKEAVKENKAGNVEEAKALLEVRDQWVDTLLNVYDQRIKYYGDDSKQYGEGHFIGKKGVALYKYQRNEKLEDAYEFLKKSIKMQKDYPSLGHLQYFFVTSDKMYSEEKLEGVEVVEDYLLVQEIMDEYIEKLNRLYQQRQNEKYKKVIAVAKKVEGNITDKFSAGKYAKCDVLVPAFEKKYEDNKENVEWLEKTINILQNRRGKERNACLQSDLYEELTIQLYNLQPSADAAYNIGQYYLKKDQPEYQKAAKYYDEAISRAEDTLKKADYYYDAAVIASARNRRRQARSYAEKALDLKPDMGKAYILIGKQYAESAGSCGDNSFEQLHPYWLAADMMAKAKSVDPEVSEEAGKLMGRYSGRFPRQEDAFMHGVKPGDTITIGCWIQRSTTARFIK